jgi:hypothetical protein
MLEQIERYAAFFIDGYNLAVQEHVRRQPFTGAAQFRELTGEQISLAVTNALRRRCASQQGSGSRRTFPC